MIKSKKVWFLSFPYLLGMVLGLALLLSHPRVLKSFYAWQAPSAYPEDALNIATALWGPVPISDLSTELSETQNFSAEELERLEYLRQLRSTLQNWAIGLLAFSLVMLLLDRRISWGQLHRRGLVLLILLGVTLGIDAWFHMDWLLKALNELPPHLNLWTFDAQSYLNVLYPKAFWSALGILYCVALAALFVIPSLLGLGSQDEKAE